MEQEKKKKGKHLPHDLKQMQRLPLEAKIRMSMSRLEVWFKSWARFDIENAEGKKRFEAIDIRNPYAEPTLKEDERIVSVIDGQVYVAFSGGKDSTVVADLSARVCQANGWTLYLLFVNTGLEYPEIQKFVKEFAEWLRNTYKIEVVLDIVRPKMRFDEVIKTYGYPVIGKKQAEAIYLGRKNIKERKYTMRLRSLGIMPDEAEQMGLRLPDKQMLDRYEKTAQGSKYNIPQHRYLLDAEFDSSAICCDVMKKAPASEYQKATGRKCILGTMAHESLMREASWLKYGCNAFEKKTPTSQPISFWTNQDILRYLKEYNIPYCPVYGEIVQKDGNENQITAFDILEDFEDVPLETTGCDRTGCIFCMFGCHREAAPNRFQRLKETHPRQYEYCIGGGEYDENGIWKPSKEGLGLSRVLDYIGVKYD